MKKLVGNAFLDGFGIGYHPVKVLFILYETVLDNLPHARYKLGIVQSPDGGNIYIYKLRHMECSNHIFV